MMSHSRRPQTDKQKGAELQNTTTITFPEMLQAHGDSVVSH